jgi:hypothetical protein
MINKENSPRKISFEFKHVNLTDRLNLYRPIYN